MADESSMKGILTSKVGGVPVILIGVVGVGGLAWYLSHKSSGSNSTDSTDAANGIASSGLDASTNPYPTISNTYINVPQPGGTATTPTSPSTGSGTPSSPPIEVRPTPFQPTPVGPVRGKLSPPHVGNPVKPITAPLKHTSKTYVVKAGDNLTKIAKANGVSLSALENANKGVITSTAKTHGIKSSFDNFIYRGEKLVIPA